MVLKVDVSKSELSRIINDKVLFILMENDLQSRKIDLNLSFENIYCDKYTQQYKTKLCIISSFS